MQPALAASEPFAWPTDAPALRPAALRGLALVAASHPELVEALKVAATDLPALTRPADQAATDPTKGLLGREPVLAMLAKIGQADSAPDRDVAIQVLAAAALLLFQWAIPEARQKRDIKDAVSKGCAAVRRWWQPSGTEDAFPDGFATLLRQYPQITDDVVPEIVEALKPLSTKGTSRLDCFERAIAFLEVDSARRPRVRKERPAQVVSPAPSPETGMTPALEADPSLAAAPPHQGMPAGHPGPPEVATPTICNPARPATPRYYRDLPSRATREAEAMRSLCGEPRRARRARQALDHVLPLARLDELHAPDWAFLKDWTRNADSVDAAIALALLYSGQSLDGLLQCRVGADISTWANEPDAFGIVMAPFGLVVPNRINPELPLGKGDNPAAESLFLPLSETLQGTGHHLLQRLQDECVRRVGGLLCEQDELEALAKRFDTDAKAAGSAMRLSRIGRLLERALYNGTGSGLVWQYVRNRVPDTVYLPALHYAQFEVIEIAECYRQACDVIDRLLQTPQCAGPQAELPWRGSVGSRFCPSDVQVRTYAHALGAAIERRPRGAPTASKIAEFHNALTRYTLALMLSASALRPSAPGLNDLRPTLVEAGECRVWLINDKPQLGSGGRVVPIAPVAYSQWLAYERHCLWLEEHSMLKPSISRFKGEAKRLFPPMFLLGPELEVQPITPSICASILEPHKENALRHWMLNALRRRGWTADRIALLAGHVGRVHSPTAPWSTAARWSRTEIHDIECVLKAAGWSRREGLGRG